MKAGIYFIRNKRSGRIYIGKSANTAQRLRQHKHRLKNGTHTNPILQASWNKYGESAFSFQHMKNVESEEERSQEEVALIARLRANNRPLYNIGDGGEGQTHAPESREKISRARKGMKFSEETCRRMSQSLTGIPCHPNCKKATSVYWKGRKRGPMPDEVKAKVSNGKKGQSHPQTDQTKEKLRKIFTGRTFSEESKAKMRASRLRVVATGFHTKGQRYTHNGESLYLSEWAERTGIPHKTLAFRLRVAKWSIAKAVETPVHPTKGKRRQ